MHPVDNTNLREKTGLEFACNTILALGADRSLAEVLQGWAEAVVNQGYAAFARIWTVSLTTQGFELEANAGSDTLIEGEKAHTPVARRLVEHIATERLPYATNDLLNEPRLNDPEWAKREGLTAFAGHPLLCRDKLVGVCTIFSKQPISDLTTKVLAATAGNIALTIARKHSEAASERAARELKIKHAELTGASQRFQQVVESVPNGILVVDRDGVITLANVQAEKMFGFPREELMGQPVEMLLPASLRAIHVGQRSSFVAESRTRAMGAGPALLAVRKDGSEFSVEIGLAPMQTDGDVSMLCSIVDLTERNRAQRDSLLLSAVVDSSGDAIMSKDLKGTITSWNTGAEHLFGYAAHEAVGESITMLIPPDRLDEEAKILSRLKRGERVEPFETIRRRKDGTLIEISLSISPMKDASGRVTGASKIARDITERKRTENKILEATRLKAEFLANMSHEIRTPMNVLVGMSALLLETDLTADQRDQAETIRKGAEALLVVISDSLDFSRMEAGKLEIDAADFAVDGVVEDVATFLAQQSGRKGLELTCFVAPDVPQYLHGDGSRVRQVLINLVGNAIKFTERGEVNLSVSVESQPGEKTVLRFEVHDTGIGISPDAQGRLFQAFTQADGSTTRRYGGTGLGLAICRKLVEMMDGTIGLKSEFGKGSTFWCQIPFERAREKREYSTDSPPSFVGVRVLIVDDNETNRIILKQQLEAWDMKAELAGNALQAVTMVREAAIFGLPLGLIVLDYGMPGMNGIDVARIVRADSTIASTPMMMLTSYGERREAEAAREVGITVYLTKPARRHQLRHAIAKVLRQAAEGAAGTSAPVAVPALRKVSKLLLVEDNVDNQNLTIRILRKYGYECAVAADGREALAMMAGFEYPLVLMDCQMPQMDGFQATAAIREREGASRRTPIVAMTAHALAGDRERCIRSGMDDYISKPVDEGLLLRTIERWVPISETPIMKPPPDPPLTDDGGRVRIPAKAGLEDLIPGYLANCRKNLVVLAEAVAKADLKAARAIGHGMKGCGAGYGFAAITEIGDSIEQAADGRNAAGITAQIARLEDYLSRLDVVYPN